MTEEKQPERDPFAVQDAYEANKPPAPEPGKEVVPSKKAQLVANEKGYIAPTTVEEAARMAQAVIVGNLAPSGYNNDPGKIMLGIMSALEAGLPPLYGLRQIAIIQGRPVIWGDGAMALVQSKNLISFYEERELPQAGAAATLPTNLNEWPDSFGYEVEIKRRGQEGSYVGRFTVGDARRAKLWLNAKKVPWLEHPLRMLKIRARAFPLRDGFADALGGIAIREEIEDTFGEEEKAPPSLSFLDDETTTQTEETAA